MGDKYEIGMLEHDRSGAAPRIAYDERLFIKRSWFLGGFIVLGLFSITQLILSGILLSEYEHDHDIQAAAKEGGLMAAEAYSYKPEFMQWASGPQGQRPPGFEGMSWQNVLEAARGTTVTWAAQLKFMGGFKDKSHNYVPFLKKQLKEKYDINLNFVDIPAQKAVERASAKGDIDFIWLNKGNFFRMRNHQNNAGGAQPLTWGPYANLIPNAALFDFQDPVINSDFGVPTNGEEMPLHIANFVMVYNKDNIPQTTTPFPPRTIGDLFEQVNSGEINYHPTLPSQFLGAPFIEQVFYHFAEPAVRNKFREEFDEDFWLQQKSIVFPQLKKFHEKLFVYKDNSTGVEYKYSADSVVRELFGKGDVHLSSEYAPGAVYNNIRDKTYPENSVAFTFNDKMVSNSNFLTIVENGPNKAGALVAINLMTSMEHQYKRFIPNKGSWNGLQAFNPFSPIVTSAGWNTVFDEIETFENAPTYESLAENRIGEFNEAYLKRMRADFSAEIGPLKELAK